MKKENKTPKVRRLKIRDIPVDSAVKIGKGLMWSLVALAVFFTLLLFLLELVFWPITGRFSGDFLKTGTDYVVAAFGYGLVVGLAVSLAGLFLKDIEIVVEEAKLEEWSDDE